MPRRTVFGWLLSPHLRAVLGFGVILAGLEELVESIESVADAFDIGAAHGVVVVGVSHLLHSLHEIVEGQTELVERLGPGGSAEEARRSD